MPCVCPELSLDAHVDLALAPAGRRRRACVWKLSSGAHVVGTWTRCAMGPGDFLVLAILARDSKSNRGSRGWAIHKHEYRRQTPIYRA
eukprot:scaffold54964_cov30-Tisochrysis_lutea.AAC.2